MPTYYVDPNAAGNDDGSSEANAWTSLQRAIDGTDGTQPSAGDTVLCKSAGSGNDETPSVTIDVDGNNGTNAGKVAFVGVNSSWNEDGTRYTIDWSTNACHGLAMGAGVDHLELRNFELKSSASSGSYSGFYKSVYDGGYATDDLFQNIVVDGFPEMGFSVYYVRESVFVRCIAKNCGDDGFYRPNSEILFKFCQAINNGGCGFYRPGELFGCVARDNSSYGFDLYSGLSQATYCIAHNNGDSGFYLYYARYFLTGCRSTANDGYGFEYVSSTDQSYGNPILLGCYAQGNTSGNTSTQDQNIIQLTVDGSTMNNMSGSDTDYGYEDSASDDYNLASDATYRSLAVELP